MTEQWQELKETIIELRDNDGTSTQQEICKFLVNYMDVLEKQMQGPCEDIAKAFQFGLAFGFGEKHDEMDRVIDEIKKVITPRQKTGYWRPIYQGDEIIGYRCSECEFGRTEKIYRANYCHNCGAKMVEPRERSDKE